MPYFVPETFFRPPEQMRESSAIPAPLYNAMRTLLRQTGNTYVFVPIRTMQYLAVVERTEVCFVDALGGYAYQNGEGGRLIQLAWHLRGTRDSLSAPVPCEIVYYFRDLKAVHRRLISDLGAALADRQRRCQDPTLAGQSVRILAFRGR
ncbi:hypothetical protein GWK36_11620 [Caldichromatium japonicum]|uniref:Uncharacterized protein n=1 Tax=Caldichromatium japonicum TaxID=2699430 RepID=A0A6G7VF79_9GAMM|nr:hypothetical protein [Caldichromatium japonicum]QIK38526.1 hypothetical protein GWK36_11620 [Caldichromatium japonicum]